MGDLRCRHFDAGRCRSCTLLGVPYVAQVAAKEERCRALVGGDPRWEPAATGPEVGFRNKAKMVVGGTVERPTLGILGPDGGVDLRDCALHTPGIGAALPTLARFVTAARVPPYDVAARRGELKHLIVTESPDGELMVRLVLRSSEALPRIRKQLPALRTELPRLRVLSVNLQPEHKAVLEGEAEVVLTEEAALPMRLGEVVLQLRPRSFFQTDTVVAGALYATARRWVDELAPRSLWDLYCGVGGFALHLAGPHRQVTGVESSTEAVESARATAAALGSGARFVAGDATAYARDSVEAPDLVVVNPPRRGIGEELAGWLERSGVRHVLYSSCRAETLARDLAAMPSLRPVRGRLLDMFPQTDHYEVLVLLERVEG
ncbi:MAG: 23S rRNA (uracil(747)-C(5))-methyltransferase RlmC [Marmoricola sp.]